ncbi:autotransporter domain-containing protein [Pusillimonas minor]|uniref:Autotransporter domain-containing protein n=1 Tax=Pusillimonas minor TaxID=2697024 RepID=A0A842HPE2_9BURK|nr:autotransporter domain-containing protein [Pusillimonas minor]
MRRVKRSGTAFPAKHVVTPVAKVLALMLAGVWGASDPVRAQGAPQTYWNGNKAAPDGVIAGGAGTWNATGMNWTDAAGNASGTYDPDGVLYFTGDGADVTVDNSAGQVSISGGLWFDSDNYAIVGDALQLTGDVSVGLRLDDLASASFAVSIRSDLTGGGALTLIGGREIALTDNNTYAGGTTIERGNLYLDRGSIYHPDADLVLVGEEFGRLSITNGGKVTTGNGYIGDAGIGSEVVVTGSGSQWVNNENVYVDGFLNIASQGTVETGGDVFIAHSSEDGALSGDSFSPSGSQERLAQKGTQGGANVWVQGGTSRLKEDVERAVGNAQYVMQGNAIAAGVEAGNDGWLMGVAGSAVSADLGFSNRQASGDMNAYFLGGYGRWQSENGRYVRGGLSYGRVNTKAQRTFNQRAIKSDFGMHGLRADVEAGVQIPWQQLNVTPYVQVSSTWLRREGFQERGSSGAE